MEKYIKAALFTPGVGGRWGLPLLFEGVPGVGKTQRTNSAARSSGLNIQALVASLREPSDFLGLPIPQKMTAAQMKSKYGEGAVRLKDLDTQVVYSPAEWAMSMAAYGRGVVFFDEINTAPPAVQAALLRVILEGQVGEFQLPPGIRFLGAQNSTEDAAGGWDLAPPLANRFGHMKWDDVDAEGWGDWLLSDVGVEEKFGDAELEENRVMELWPSAFAKARGVVAGFIRRRPNLLLNKPKAGDPQASKAWPSPRTWELAARAMAGAEVHDLDRVETEEFVGAFVGNAVVSELCTWLAEADLPDPADVLDGKVAFKHDESRLDRSAMILQSCAAFVSSESCKKRTPRAEKLWSILEGAMDTVDVIVPSARVLIRSKLGGAQIKASRPVLLEIQPVLAAAGIR